MIAIVMVSLLAAVSADQNGCDASSSPIEITFSSTVEDNVVITTSNYSVGDEIVVEAPAEYEYYVFLGWEAADGTFYADGDVITVSENMDLTAQWEYFNVMNQVQVPVDPSFYEIVIIALLVIIAIMAATMMIQSAKRNVKPHI